MIQPKTKIVITANNEMMIIHKEDVMDCDFLTSVDSSSFSSVMNLRAFFILSELSFLQRLRRKR